LRGVCCSVASIESSSAVSTFPSCSFFVLTLHPPRGSHRFAVARWRAAAAFSPARGPLPATTIGGDRQPCREWRSRRRLRRCTPPRVYHRRCRPPLRLLTFEGVGVVAGRGPRPFAGLCGSLAVSVSSRGLST